MANILEQLDAQVAEILAGWNLYTTVIAVILVAFVAYPLISFTDPDTHPLLLARQARPAPVRNQGESAVYRSLETPHGYPLRAGLGVKDVDAPRWSAGRDGDLRDAWRTFARGDAEGVRGKIMTVFGKEEVDEHEITQINKEINIIGGTLSSAGRKKVAVYIPNCIEYLSTIFACAFYGLSPILIPYNQPQDVVIKLLQQTNADCLIANAGSLPLADLCKNVTSLRSITWVVEKSSRHMDWTGAPDETPDKVTVAVWHSLIEENAAKARTDLLENGDVTPGPVTQVWLKKQGVPGEVVEFSQQNMTAAVASLAYALPMHQRYGPTDLLLPADTFSNSYVLCQTLAALFQHASVAINSVAGPGVDLSLVCRNVSPTVIIASAETLATLHKTESARRTGFLQRLGHNSLAQALAAGTMTRSTFLSRTFSPQNTITSPRPWKLRLILVSERNETDAPVLSSAMLNDLRIYTSSRVCYALTVPRVAGAVSQTNLYDYRTHDGKGYAHFGVPVSSVEIKLRNKDEGSVAGNTPIGEVVAIGPSVVGGQARLGFEGRIREDSTLGYA